ncbi:flagellar hook-basal body protein [Rossellomorea marisflavi]|uniref:flagellar hook-basal body protein n=1 Tax=Rossellomorea marisflavi TaxID=189381 RepID=UPI00203CF7D0|nr:flagellar hook-basal body protein [Rossellomorea marisflavi]MCM2590802.1 flagellar hook-basal body protein [Rossellomorea marisflavi]
MNRMMVTATNTLGQLQKQMDLIGNNLSNADTTGYKKREATFSDLLVQQVNNQRVDRFEGGRLTPLGVREGSGARLSKTALNLTQGTLKATGRSLDFALKDERQFFKVNDGTDVRYTRDGAFYSTPMENGRSMLVNASGFPILDENDDPITFSGEASTFELGDNGVLSITGPEGTENVDLGIVTIARPQFLEQLGGNLIGLRTDVGVTRNEVLTNLTGAGRTGISISQESLEASNVDMGKEMTDLLNVQRSYQFQTRSITMADQMMGLVNGIR